MQHSRSARRLAAVLGAASIAGATLMAGVGAASVAAAQACPGMALTLSNNSTAAHGFGVDDDVEVRLNGTVIFLNNDEGASNVGSPQLTAQYGDQLRIIASNSTIFGGHEFIDSLALFCNANANVQVLEANPTEFASGAAGHIFFDRTYTIDFIGGDTNAPSVTITTPADGASFLLGASVPSDYGCVDEAGGSGLATCVGTVGKGLGVDTFTVGPHTFVVTGTDNAGNSATVSNDYIVVWGFGGFLQPVDARPTLNALKAGAAVPVKFSLGGDRGLSIFAAGYPKSQLIPCDSAADLDGIEQTVSAGGSSLAYDATSDTYTYVWKTDKAWVGACRQLVLGFADGSIQRANFKLK